MSVRHSAKVAKTLKYKGFVKFYTMKILFHHKAWFLTTYLRITLCH